jgi:hypothetical protein
VLSTLYSGRSGQGGSEGSFQGATDIQDFLPNNNSSTDASFLEIVNHASVDWMSLSMSIDCQAQPIFVLVVTGKTVTCLLATPFGEIEPT